MVFILNSMSILRRNSIVKNEKGQVALFVALIFQVLFVFFAMLINVGLLVHHKINLQNSVDIAAYYAAAKQAEVLNAIAHTNYQIRQSWKLLTFRYRHLGSYGDDSYPGGKGNPHGNQSDVAGTIFPAFCINYDPFNFVSTSENMCLQSGKPIDWTLTHPVIPATMSSDPLGLFNFQSNTVAAAQAVQQAMYNDCQEKSAFSLYALSRFIWAYKLDIANRKRLIIKLARNISENDSDFTDLDGDSVSDGIKNTINNNLTYQNKESLTQIKFYNALAQNGCGSQGDPDLPPAWLSEIFIYPVFWGFMGDCSLGQSVYKALPVNAGNGNTIIADLVATAKTRTPPLGTFIEQALKEIKEPSASASSKKKLYASSLGFEKNPWCMGYVGVHAETKPQIPFSPFGSVTLKATAYAKPFGGTVGPWYGSKWNSGSDESDKGTEVQTVSPPRIKIGEAWSNPKDPRLAADYARYVGDSIGTKSNISMYNFAKAINFFNHGTMSLNWWNHLVDPANDNIEAIGSNGDILAYGNDGNSLHMREIEIAAIAPDNFDTSYYSVEPDFYRNYFVRLQKQENNFGFPVRGDLGQRKNDSGMWKSFSIKDQVAMINQSTNNNLKWYVVTFPELLTSFKADAPDRQGSLPDPQLNFGKCTTQVNDSDPPEKATTGNCIAGGRVGYSVKLVDGEFLNVQDLPLGGSSTTGPLKNPPPELSSWTELSK